MGMRTRKLVYGWGIFDAPYPVRPRVNGKTTQCSYYQAWIGMLRRAYDPKHHERFPTYKGTSVCEEWRYFMTFRAWMMTQDWEGKHLDKDLIKPGNKIYSPANCVFVPAAINLLLTDSGATRGKYPQGVSWHKPNGKFQVHIRKHGKHHNLGLFDTPEEAAASYIKAKVLHVWDIAMRQTDQRIKDGLTFHCFKLQGVM